MACEEGVLVSSSLRHTIWLGGGTAFHLSFISALASLLSRTGFLLMVDSMATRSPTSRSFLHCGRVLSLQHLGKSWGRKVSFGGLAEGFIYP